MLKDRCNGRAKRFPRLNVNVLLALSLMALAVSPWRLAAEEHVVSVNEVRQQVLSAQDVRQNQLRDIREFLGVAAVQESLQFAAVDADQFKTAVSLLEDDQLTRLAERARSIHSDLRAGALTNEQLTYIVIALATAVVVILAT